MEVKLCERQMNLKLKFYIQVIVDSIVRVVKSSLELYN